MKIKKGDTVKVISGKDKGKTGDAAAGTKSGKLEQIGVNVRYVNKIMHHKYVIIDGPRTSLDQAQSTTLITGSANWSSSAGTP